MILIPIFLVSILTGMDFKRPRFVVEAVCLFLICAGALLVGVRDESLSTMFPIPVFWGLLIVLGLVVASGLLVGRVIDFFLPRKSVSTPKQEGAGNNTNPHHHP